MCTLKKKNQTAYCKYEEKELTVIFSFKSRKRYRVSDDKFQKIPAVIVDD